MKKQYKITRTETHDFGNGEVQEYKKIFYRWGVSEKQVIAWIKNQMGDNKYNMITEWRGDGARIVSYKAEEVITSQN